MRFIGCKTQLLENIKEVIDMSAPDAKFFCDIFSGTSTVARHFKQWYEVTSNDLLYFSYCLQMATIANDSVPDFPHCAVLTAYPILLPTSIPCRHPIWKRCPNHSGSFRTIMPRPAAECM